MAELPDIRFPLIDSEKWNKIRTQSINTIKNAVHKPELKDYQSEDNSQYSRDLINGTIIALVVIFAASFAFSATKQIIATDTIMSNLSEKFGINHTWLIITIFGFLFLCEIGALVFSIGSSVFRGDLIQVGKFNLHPVGWLFRGFSILAAFQAIAANIAVTSLDINTVIPWYQWLATISAPLFVLGIGLYFEQLILTSMKDRKVAQAKLAEMMVDYNLATKTPENHSDFNKTWKQNIYSELTRKPKNQTLIYAWLDSDPERKLEIMKLIVDSEIASHDIWTDNDGIESRLKDNPLPSFTQSDTALIPPTLNQD